MQNDIMKLRHVLLTVSIILFWVLWLLLVCWEVYGQADVSRHLDLTGNRVINAADAWVVADGWWAMAEEGGCVISPLADRDVDGSGCLTVADVQVVLAEWGESANPDEPLQPPTRMRALSDTTFIVNVPSDESDSNAGDGVCQTLNGDCSLRAALEEANTSAGADTITFDIRNPDGSCPDLVTIQPTQELVIDDAFGDGVTIDGYTQCDASPNTQAITGNAQIKIELLGSGTPTVHGLAIRSSHNTIRGLAIYNFDPQIHLTGDASYNRIEGNFLGTNADNSFFRPNSAAYSEGIRLRYGASYNIIGCGVYDENNSYLPCKSEAEFYAARNIIAGNSGDGAVLFGTDVVGNRFVGNYVGLKQDGVTMLSNTSDGLDLGQGGQDNWIGGSMASEGNVIAGNLGDGVEVSHSTETKNNHIVGNYIGVNATGTSTIPNQHNGITLEDTVDGTEISDNLIAGNGANGIRLYMEITNSQINNNLIGVGANGIIPMPNGTNPDTLRGRNGILLIGGSHNNQINQNVIAHHPEHGILLSNNSDASGGFGATYYNTISQNSIYNNRKRGIELDSALDPLTGQDIFANQGLPAPEISHLTIYAVTGTACANCTVELFLADKNSVNDPNEDDYGEGKTFIASTVADENGYFITSLSCLVAEGQLVTATATDNFGNTSQFSRNVALETSEQLSHDINQQVGADLGGNCRIYLPIVIVLTPISPVTSPFLSNP